MVMMDDGLAVDRGIYNEYFFFSEVYQSIGTNPLKADKDRSDQTSVSLTGDGVTVTSELGWA